MELSVDGIVFKFAENWKVSKYDDWAFYRRHFIRVHAGVKAVDLLALSPDKTLYLIEAKDYRQKRREKDISLAEEVVLKVCWTLAALLPARVNGAKDDESTMAHSFLKARKLCIILHLEQPPAPSKLFPQIISPANLRQKLKQSLRSIDPHPDVVETCRMGNVAGKWSVFVNKPPIS